MDLEGKNALVTGGSRGIGRAIALALGRKGSNVAVNYHRRAAAAGEVVELLREMGVKAIAVQADVSDYDQVQRMVQEVVSGLGGLQILVNNAGIVGSHTALAEIPVAEWRQLIDVNLSGTFFCCQIAAAALKRNGGKIVNISSIAGKMGGTIGSHYAASKAGVIGLTFALARELAPRVTVNAIAPGPVDTDFISTEVKERLSRSTPFGRIATPEEIAHATIFLLENDYISGEVIDVNAGRYMD